MVDVLTETTIKAAIEKVATYACNPDNAPEWYVNIRSSEWRTEKPLKLGTQIAFKAKFLGKELAYVYEIAEYQPNKKLVMKTADGPFPMETTYIFEAVDKNTTKMTLRNKGVPSGFSKLFAPFMVSAMRKANQKDLNMIKSILEG